MQSPTGLTSPALIAHVDYLVGGLRIGLHDGSTTPGPRSHIVGVVDAMRARGLATRLFVASEQPLLRRFARMPEGAAAGGAGRRMLGDAVRLLACLWTLVRVNLWSADSRADVVYERAAVLQCPGLAHRRRRAAVYVVESNGIFSRETASDRHALASPRLAAAIERRVYRTADVVVVVSEHLRDELCAFTAMPPDKVIVVPNAVRDDVFSVPRRPNDTRRVVGFSGSLVPWQRLELLLEGVAQTDDPIDVEILGDGPELQPLRALARELAIEQRVQFLGRIDHDAAIQRMASWTAGYAAHAASSSGSMYHSPLKLYEYAGLGLTLIATDTADARLLAGDGVEVIVIDGDAAAVARALHEHARRPPRTPADLAALRHHLCDLHSWSARVDGLLKCVQASAEALRMSQSPSQPAIEPS